MNILDICPPHLSYVATLPWEIQKKVIFNIFQTKFEVPSFWLSTDDCPHQKLKSGSHELDHAHSRDD